MILTEAGEAPPSYDDVVNNSIQRPQPVAPSAPPHARSTTQQGFDSRHAQRIDNYPLCESPHGTEESSWRVMSRTPNEFHSQPLSEQTHQTRRGQPQTSIPQMSMKRFLKTLDFGLCIMRLVVYVGLISCASIALNRVIMDDQYLGEVFFTIPASVLGFVIEIFVLGTSCRARCISNFMTLRCFGHTAQMSLVGASSILALVVAPEIRICLPYVVLGFILTVILIVTVVDLLRRIRTRSSEN